MLNSTSDREATPRRLDLLVTVKSSDEGSSGCFGNILELGPKALLLEASRPQETGRALTLKLILPGQRKEPDPIVSLPCVVHRILDASQLHYELRIQKLDDRTQSRLGRFLAQGSEVNE